MVFDEKSYINTGQVFYKNSDIAKQIILGAWINHGAETKNSWDQARINKYIKNNELHQNVLVHSPKDFNITPKKYTEKDFIVHMYGYHTWKKTWDSLEDIMKDYERKYNYLLVKELFLIFQLGLLDP